MKKPCEYCGADLPLGVDRETRRVRSHHFLNCEVRILRDSETVESRPERSEFVGALRCLLQQARLSDLPANNFAIQNAEKLLQREDA